MADTLKELLAQRAALERQIIDAQRAEKADAIAQIRSLMTEHGLTLADLQSSPKPAKAARNGQAGKKVAAKYQDGQGNTWSGRGLQPRWLRDALAAGRSLSDFAI